MRSPGERAGLTRGAVLAEARALLGEAGLSGLTMRALALRLGVAPNALYSHVPGKTELVDALLDDLLSAVDSPPPDVPDPLAGVARLMTSTYEVLLAHPDLVPLYLARQGARGPNAVALGERMDALLARAGVADATIPQARATLIVHTIGQAAYVAGSDEPSRAHPTFTAGLQWLLTGMTADVSPSAPPPPSRHSP